jgi:hypothetical protein
MDKINDPKLEALLRGRAAPVMPEHLDAHIVAMAARTPQDTAMEGRESAAILRPFSPAARPWYADLVQLFVIPKPAYAFSAVLVLGIVIGVSLGVSPADTSASDWTNLFSSGETWL